MSREEDHLRLLAVFHYVVGGISALFSFFPTIHLVVGIALLSKPCALTAVNETSPPQFGGWLFVLVASAIILGGLAFSECVIAAGRNLQKRTRYTFCQVMAGVECIFMPFGTVLGVFTLITLMKEPTKALFVREPVASGGRSI